MNKGLIAGLIAAVVIVGVGIGVLLMKKPTTETLVEKVEVVDKEGKTTVAVSEKLTTVTGKKAIKGKMAPVNVVPADALLYLSAVDIRKTWDSLKDSNFWAQITALPVWETANAGQSLALLQQQASANLGIDLNEENIMGLFGQEVDIALASGPAGALNPSLLVIAKLDPSAGMEAKITTMLDKLQGPLSITGIDYKGTAVTRVINPSVPGPQFNYAFVADLFLMTAGIDDSVMKQAIDIAEAKGKGALGESKKYKESMDKLKVTGELRGLVYVDVAKIVDLVKAVPLPGAGLDQGALIADQIESTLGVIDSIAGAMSFSYVKGALDTVNMSMFFAKNKDIEDPAILEAWGVGPAVAENLTFVPSGAIVFSDSNTVNLAGLL